jgi:hypothetical protein
MDGVIVAHRFFLKPPQAGEVVAAVCFLRHAVDFAEPLMGVAHLFLPVLIFPFGFGVEAVVIPIDVVV